MSDQAEKGGNFQFLGGNITGKFLEVKEDFLSKKSSNLVTVPTVPTTLLYLRTVDRLDCKKLPTS